MSNTKRWIRIGRVGLLVFAAMFLFLQLLFKFYFGLGSLPIYIENPHYEYIYAPDQDLYRFHHHVKTNSLGLRCGEPKKSDRIRIIKFGDSVINGGPHVDQDNLSSSILEKELTQKFAAPVRVFNVSAQSWGPDNAFAFLKEHGDFDAKIFVLVFSSHDLHDNMHFKKVVGEHRAWPASQPWCALTDGINRYGIPKVKSWFGAKTEDYDYLFDFDDSKINTGWEDFIKYAQENNIHLITYVHATLDEIKNKSYDTYGQQLLQILDTNGVKVIRGIDRITSNQLYRDKIHLNEKGHQQLAKILQPYLEKAVDSLLKLPASRPN